MRYSNIDEDVLLSDDVRDSVNAWSNDVTGEERFTATVTEYAHSNKVRIAAILLIVAVAFIMAFFSISRSPMSASIFDVPGIIWSKIVGNADGSNTTFWTLYATPPVLGALIGGAGLAICGAIMQSTLRNPMADPYTTGISSGASFGAAIAMSSGSLLVTNPNITVIMAFIFSMIPVVVILGMSKFTNASPITIVMTGIGIMYIFNALTSLIRIKEGSLVTIALDNWLMGDVQLVEWSELLPMFAIVATGFVISMLLASKINVLATGDESAKALGIDADRLRILCMILTAVVSAGVISFTGLIGFVGLVCPHIVRMFVGSDNRYLIPASAAVGSLLMVSAHLVGRTILSPTLIPVGIIMSCIGGPLFIWLVLRRNKNAW